MPSESGLSPKEAARIGNLRLKVISLTENCSTIDSIGNIVAQIGVKKEVDELMASKDLYHVAVKPGIDQAFVFGVIAVLDCIYGESTRC